MEVENTETQPPAETTPAAPAALPAAAAAPELSIAVDTPVARPVPKRQVLGRRLFLLGGFWTGMSALLVALVGSPLDFMWPRGVKGFGGPITVTPDRIPEPGGDPIRIVEGRFWLVNLEAGKTPNGEDTPGGVLALWQKCPHLGCTVPWRPDFEFQARKGWFRCPCHGSTYTREGGVIVFGPAPRPLDVFPIEVQNGGSLVVQTGRQYEGTGSAGNPSRAVPLEPGATTPPPA
ncbi:MAG TPA: ubiquinol-cytochrome c reductase iron-sulfur subunit [Dehalococcoidia bacterium]|nr:ubiquinol-cytochrome c reductase iron-sulfur subunit [Dehalococcoidia bacterium]